MVKVTKEVGYPEGGKTYSAAPESVGKDPRSEIISNAVAAESQIDKGTKVDVQGEGAILASKKRKAIWF